MNKHSSLKVKFNNDFVQVNNSEFVEGTALIAYQGDNRNLSDITELAFTNAMPSLSLIPIVGNWLPDKQNFGGHDIAIEWQGNTLVLKDKTVPYGVVKENHNAQWIELDDNGVIHKYLQADVVLWAGRYPEQIQKVIDDGINQSMEISVSDFSIKESGNFQINSFEYSALCLLGKDINENGEIGENNVDPCFEQASVVVNKYNFNEQFKSQFNNLLFEFNNQISNLVNTSVEGGDKKIMTNEGGNDMEEKIKLLEQYNLTLDSFNFNIEEFSIEQLKEKINEHFALLASQKQEEIANALRVEKFRDRWGDECSKYSYTEHNDTEVFAYDRQENWNLYGFVYTMSGDKVIIDFESKKRKKFEIVDFVEGDMAFELFPKEAVEYELSTKEKELQENFSIEKEFAIKEIQDKFDVQPEIGELNLKISEYEENNILLTEQFNSVKNENEIIKSKIETIQSEFNSLKTENETLISSNEILTKTNTSLQEFKSNIEIAQQEAFETQQLQLKTELIENFSKVLTAEEIKSVEDKNLSLEDMDKEFKLMFASKELSTKFAKKIKKTETEIPIFNFSIKKKEDWTSLIPKK